MIVGGVATSLLGRPRLTQDIDALAIVDEASWADATRSAAQYDIHPRIEDALQFARRSRVLLMRHSGSGVDIDVILGDLPFERAALARAVNHDFGGVRIRLPRVEDLLVMKAVASRPKDLQDIEGLLAAHPEVDASSARRWVREFAAAMNRPEVLVEFDARLSRRPTQR
jgi:hypothetical protein